jgi:hypothetical protein
MGAVLHKNSLAEPPVSVIRSCAVLPPYRDREQRSAYESGQLPVLKRLFRYIIMLRMANQW